MSTCKVCGKRASYQLPGTQLCKEHYLTVLRRVDGDHAPLAVTRARSTGTTIHLHTRTYESDPAHPWELVCVEHGGIICHSSKRAARMWMSAPEEWCPTCQENDR